MNKFTFPIPEVKLPEEFGVWIDKNSTDQLNQMQQYLGGDLFFPKGHGDNRYSNGPFSVELAHHEYIKITNLKAGKKLAENFKSKANNDLTVLVYNFVDMQE